MRFKKQFVPATTEPAVVSLEAELGFRLPDDYREFLLQYNGGQPEATVFRWGSGSYMGSSVRYFYSVTEDFTFSLAYHYKIYALAGRIPKWTLPISPDAGGNLILLALGEAHPGKVFFWDHDIEGLVADPASPEHLTLLADSFSEFCNRLLPYQRRAH
jgi:hypothetical protein